MKPDDARRHALDMGEARPPHQGAIAEHPKVLGQVIETHIHGGWGSLG
jgi:hypothetical protein